MGIKITRKQLSKPVPVYDITVPETSSFLANNVVVHNCSEICLPTEPDESFVCNLASMNIGRYDYWKDTNAVNIMIRMLDMVMEEFIDKSKDIPYFEAAHKFAKNHRALGLGVLGWHDYLQEHNIAFESYDAMKANNEIFSNIRAKADEETRNLAKQFGEPEVCKGYGVRNSTLLAIAPTTSSSYILGAASPGIEPLNTNYFVKDLSKGNFTYRNPRLKRLLESKGKDDASTWRSILINDGSVEHLDCLSDHEKSVYRTFGEINQLSIIQQAAQRQKYIDQSQSLNTRLHPATSTKDANALLVEAWKLGVKTLYYQRGVNPSQELARNIMKCSSCEA